PVSVIVRTSAQLERVVAANPFLKQAAGKDKAREDKGRRNKASEDKAHYKTLHVTFLADAAPKAGLAALASIHAGEDRWHAYGAEIYLCCPNGYARSKLNNTALERTLGVRATTRNWNTVTALCAMAGG
ncbi:MAG: hypothetical protein J2P50_20310, partial [Hyphomicrobiaceae bacterium]|nr:hypothetical protein [Hyphomicrobiaceae bacterium]